jgi:membrane-bound serine protease (ClpP class)
MSVTFPAARAIATLLLALLFPLLARSGDASPAGNAVESAPAPASTTALAPASALAAAPTRVMVIPVREEIATPILYIIRRGLKEAIEQKADVVVLDMKTPGGALDVTFEIMEALGRFPGRTITYVNTEAISAGAFISAMTGEIWFAPTGVIGAAAPVMATGGEIDASMKQKIVSYLRARVRAVSEGKGYRGEVISAMIDANYELKIGDKIIKPKGELLSLTASEANELYGDPAQPLLGAGTAATLDELLTQKLGATAASTRRFEVSWSEEFAVLLNSLRPLLLGLGLLLAVIEFKTPGFGVFGVAAAVLLAAVFFGHYIAGFSGHEPVLVFVLGLFAVMVELIFFPGVVVVAAGGLLLMLGSLVWSMADLWPNEPITFSPEVFLEPVANLVAGLGVAVVLGLLLARFLPRGWIWDRMVLATSVSGAAQMAGSAPDVVASAPSLIGARGVAVTGLYPSGQVEVDGHRYEARLAVGSVERGAAVVVRSRSEFGLVVETIES